MKTIALSEHTFEILKMLKDREKMRSFEELIRKIVIQKEEVPDSMFGALKGKSKPFTSLERRQLWRERV